MDGDIVISKTGTLGLLGIMTPIFNRAVIVSRLAKITPDPSIMGKYLLFYFLKYLSETNYWNRLSSGSTMPLINLTIIKNAKIIFPNDTELRRKFELIISSLYEKINKNLNENLKIEELRDTLLPKLMSGEIRVPIENTKEDEQ